jgi:5-carboxymethyl-2-hydroxymuconic-semialdehyde dehydrogenase
MVSANINEMDVKFFWKYNPVHDRLRNEMAEKSGVPVGIWNMVNGFAEEAGRARTEHPDIKAIAFVGESQTRSMIMKQGADTLKRVHFELGGENPVIVFKDSDLERAADAAIFMIYSLNGERCTSFSRLLVEADIYENFTAKIAEKAAKITLGHPLDPAATIGPLIDPNHLQKVKSYFDIAMREGATIATGGRTVNGPGGGCYVAPTLFIDATNDMRISQK